MATIHDVDTITNSLYGFRTKNISEELPVSNVMLKISFDPLHFELPLHLQQGTIALPDYVIKSKPAESIAKFFSIIIHGLQKKSIDGRVLSADRVMVFGDLQRGPTLLIAGHEVDPEAEGSSARPD